MPKLQFNKKGYEGPTPKKWRNLGNILLVVSPMIQGSIMGLPVADHTKLWINFIVGMLGVIGKVITMHIVDDNRSEEIDQENNLEQPPIQ